MGLNSFNRVKGDVEILVTQLEYKTRVLVALVRRQDRPFRGVCSECGGRGKCK